jgi:uncharacterized protein YjbI with pentapeptide repeats
MANEEHVKILRQGVSVWNEWRIRHPDIPLDLADAILRETDLSGADLRGAILVDSDLFGTKLIGADLRDAMLNATNFSHANLSGATLTDASCNMTSFDFADLSETCLRDVRLMGHTSKARTLWRGSLRRTLQIYETQRRELQ